MENVLVTLQTIISRNSSSTREASMQPGSRTLLSVIGSLLLLCIGVEQVRARRERSLIISLLRRTSTFTPVDLGSTVMRDNLSSYSTITLDQSSSSNISSSSWTDTLCMCRLRVALSALCRLKSTLRRILIRMIGIVMPTLSM